MTGITSIFGYSEEMPLLFTQLYFWVFYLAVFLVFLFVYPGKSLRNAWLFLASLFFYYKSGGYFFSLLILSTVVDFFVAQMIFRARKRKVKRLGVWISLLVNLGVLAYFKYTYFLVHWINELFQTDLRAVNYLASWTNALAGTHFDASVIILPVGISFYTFQTISYTLDVYRGKLKPVKNILDFGFYVSFFPQLVAGPIVRAASFIPQLYQEYRLTRREFGHAVFLIISGLAKKMLVADYISIHFVDRVFHDPSVYTGVENLFALYGYSIQIYCDFSGYTDMAIGLALLLGFRLPVNFNSPYKAANLADFWRRWHISLSSWLRDYLYIPLGGNRKGLLRTYVHLFVTMLLGGLWHGAHIRFVIWGGMHGIGLAVLKIWQRLFRVPARRTRFRRFVSVFFTFHLVTFLWIFFRAATWDTAISMIRQIGTRFGTKAIPAVMEAYAPVLLIMAAACILHWLPSCWKENIRGSFIKTPSWIKLIVAVVLVFLIVQMKSTTVQPFIYFQF